MDFTVVRIRSVVSHFERRHCPFNDRFDELEAIIDLRSNEKRPSITKKTSNGPALPRKRSGTYDRL